MRKEASPENLAAFDELIARTKAGARDYQRRIVAKVIDRIDPTNPDDTLSSVMIESAVGSGKSVMALAIAQMMRERYPDMGIAFVAMRNNLLTQIVRYADAFGFDIPDLTPVSMFDKDPPTHDASGRKIDLLLQDECHHAPASSMLRVLTRMDPKHMVGMTGTPYRSDNMTISFQDVIKDAGIKDLVLAGYLSKYDRYSIDAWTPQIVCDAYLADPARWGKSVMFWREDADARECMRLLSLSGVSCAYVSGTQSYAEREQILSRFADGEIQVVVNLFVLTEGWSEDSLQTVWVRDSSKGPTIQMAGRGLRLHADMPVKQIVQSAKTRYPVDRLVTPNAKYQLRDGHWVELGINDKARKMSDKMRARMATVELKHNDLHKRMMTAIKDSRKGRRRAS